MQMPALFMQQNAIEEAMQEEEHQRDHKYIQAAQWAKNNIIVYAWTQVSLLPLWSTPQ
jgi:hypothetical protein